MAQQAESERKTKPTGNLVQCTYCGHVWLARSTLPILTCSVCHNHIVARDNIVTTDILNQKEKAGGQNNQNLQHDESYSEHSSNSTLPRERKEAEKL